MAGETLHFSYDSSPTSKTLRIPPTPVLLQKSGAPGLPSSVDWNAYRTDGELVRLTLTADQFLGLYAGGALAHKAACMAAGGAKKAALEVGGAA